jgi:hypothetical protein
METEFKTLSEKIITAFDIDNENMPDYQCFMKIQDVKEKIQKAQARLKELTIGFGTCKLEQDGIDKIFLEEFGDKLL